MSEDQTTQQRPPLVTVAAYMIMVGSVFVVLMVWDRITALHSLDTREALQPILDDPQIKKAGITLPELLAIIRIVAMVAAGCATAMAILGYQALQRSRAARLWLTVLAVPLFIAGVMGLAASGGYLASAVAAAVGTLWLGQARLWFDGKPIPATPGASPRQSSTPTRPVWPPPYDPGQGAPHDGTTPPPAPPNTPPTGPTAPPDQPGGGWQAPPPAAWTPPPTSRYGVPTPPAVSRGGSGIRPPAVLWACVLTWIFSALAIVLLTATVVVLASDPDLILTRMHERNPDLASQGVTDHMILVISYVTCGVLVVWSLAAVVIAVLALRGNRPSRYLLIASAAGAAVFCLMGVLGSVVVLVPLAAAIVTIACLVRGDVNAWFAGSAAQRGRPEAP